MSYYIFEVEGKSRSDAEKQALEALGCSRNEVLFESIGQTSGLMRMLKRDSGLVRVLPGEDGGPGFESHARGVLLTIVRKLGVDAHIQQTGERDENFYIELGSEESGFLIGKHGRTLDAIQFLVNLIVNTRTRSGKRIMVDVEQYRERREKSLKKLASRMAERVARTGKPVLLNYMNPYERRIIHLALESDERVYTESDGNGVYKRVRVIPADRKSRAGGGERRDAPGRNQRERERDRDRADPNGRGNRADRPDRPDRNEGGRSSSRRRGGRRNRGAAAEPVSKVYEEPEDDIPEDLPEDIGNRAEDYPDIEDDEDDSLGNR